MEQKLVKVRGDSDPAAVAGSIARSLRAGVESVLVQAVGDRANLNAALALSFATRFVEADGIALSFTISSETLTRDGQQHKLLSYLIPGKAA